MYKAIEPPFRQKKGIPLSILKVPFCLNKITAHKASKKERGSKGMGSKEARSRCNIRCRSSFKMTDPLFFGWKAGFILPPKMFFLASP